MEKNRSTLMDFFFSRLLLLFEDRPRMTIYLTDIGSRSTEGYRCVVVAIATNEKAYQL